MASTTDFIVKNGIQVSSNLVVGAYTLQSTPVSNGAIISGRVGIGTSQPLEQLEVAGNVRITDSALVGNLSVTNTTAATSSTTGALTVAGGAGIAGNVFAGSNMLVAGRVGIGTTLAASTLYVAGKQIISNVLTSNTMVYNGKSLDISAQEAAPGGPFISPDGIYLYVMGASGNDLTAYQMSTPWEISTATHIGQSVSLAAQNGNPYNVFFDPTGKKMWMIGSVLTNNAVAVYEYDLSIPWNIFSNSLTYSQSNLNVTSSNNAPRQIYWKPDGTSLFLVGTGTGTYTDSVMEFAAATPWTIADMSNTVVSSLSVAAQDTNPLGLNFTNDGSTMLITGDTGNDITVYDLSEPWTITSARYRTQYSLPNLVSNITVPVGSYLKPDGSALYVTNDLGSGTGNVVIYQFDLGNNSRFDLVGNSTMSGDVLMLQNATVAGQITGWRANFNGNVGIGTTNPTQILDVAGSALFRSNVSISNATAATSTTTGALTVAGGVGISGNIYAGGRIFGIVNTAINASNIVVTDTTTNATFYPAFVEATSGNVGIRADAMLTFNPGTNQLSLTGNAWVQNSGRFGNISVTNSTAATNSTTGALIVNGGIGVANGIVAGGNIGIGTTAITGYTNAALAVYGNIQISNVAGRQSSIRFPDGSILNSANISNIIIVDSSSTNQDYYVTFVDTTSGNTIIRADTDYIYNPFTTQIKGVKWAGSIVNADVGGTGLGSISNGSLLRGSNDPQTLIELSVGTLNQVLVSNGDTPVWGAINLSNTSITSGILPMSRGGTSSAITPVSGSLLYSTSDSVQLISTSQLFFDNITGNFGLGFSSPTQRLDVRGNIYSTGSLWAGNMSVTNSTAATSSTTGALTVAGGVGIGGNLFVAGNLIVNGNISYINSNVVVIEDPTVAIGTGPNGAPLTTTDSYDRGLEYHYYAGGGDRYGFIGWQNSTGQFVYISNATAGSSTGIYSGPLGDSAFGNIVVGSASNTPKPSTSTTTGALIIQGTGGIGVGGNIFAGSNVLVAGQLGVGTITPRAKLDIQGDGGPYGPLYNPSAVIGQVGGVDILGEYGTMITNVAATGARYAIGFQIDSVNSPGSGYTGVGQLITRITSTGGGGAYGLAVSDISNTVSGHANRAVGIYVGNIIGNTSGTFTEPSNASGMRIGTVTYSGASVTGYSAGLQIDNLITNPTTTDNAYAIYSLSTAKSYFAGNVGIGNTIISPAVKLQVTGNILITNSAWFGNASITNTTTSTSTTTGALTVAGGVGIAGNIYVGDRIFGVANTAINASNIVVTDTTTNATFYPAFVEATTGNVGIRADSMWTFNPNTNQLSLTGNAWIQNSGRFGNLSVTNTTASTSSTTGALTVAGGAGIRGNIYAGSNILVSGSVGIGITYVTSNPLSITKSDGSTAIGGSNAVVKVNNPGGILNSTAGIEFFVSNDVTSNTGRLAGIYGFYKNFNAAGLGGELVFATNTAGDAIIDERMRIDNTGRVGIGTTTPSYLLSLSGDVAQTVGMERTNAGTNGYGLTLLAGGAKSATADLNGGDLTLSSGIATGTGSSNIYFQTATAGTTATTDRTPSTKMVILGNGSVGIGTLTPTALLQVVGSGARYASFPSNGRAVIVANDNTDVPVLTLRNTFDGGYGLSIRFELGYGGSASTEGTASTGAAINAIQEQVWTATAATRDSALTFFTSLNGSAGEKMRISSDGYVGIGTTSPTQQLDVRGNIYSTGSLWAGNLSVTNTAASTSTTTGALTVAGGVGIAGNAWISNATIASNGSLIVQRSATQYLQISEFDSDTAPYFRSYSDTTNAKTINFDSRTNAAGTAKTAGNLGYVFYTNGATVVQINESGNVATAWNDQLAAVRIVGGLALSNSIYANGGFNGFNVNISSNTSTVPINGIWSPAVNSLAFSTSGTEKARIDSSGRLGLGITSPTQLLDVRGNIYSTGSLWIGNVSITNTTAATSSTTGALTVAGGAGITGSMFAGGTVQGANVNVTGANLPANGLYLPTTNTLGFATNSTEKLRIDSSGNVGIGATPSAKLHVAGGRSLLNSLSNQGANPRNYGPMLWSDNYFGMELGHNGSIWTTRIITRDGDGGIEFGEYPNGATTNVNDFSPWMTIINNGSVGINITAPTQKLDVRGNIYSTGSGWIGNLSVTNTTASTSTTTGALRVAGGAGVANGIVIGGNVGIGTTSTVGYTNNVLAIFGRTTNNGNIYVANADTTSGIVFSDGSFQNTAFISDFRSYVTMKEITSWPTSVTYTPRLATNLLIIEIDVPSTFGQSSTARININVNNVTIQTAFQQFTNVAAHAGPMRAMAPYQLTSTTPLTIQAAAPTPPPNTGGNIWMTITESAGTIL